MPELPEVETIRRDLQGEVVGRKIKSVEVRNGRTVRRHPSGSISAPASRAIPSNRSIVRESTCSSAWTTGRPWLSTWG